ncbi:PREDICTED: Zinc finger, partial [Prunus dulcis]
MNPAFPHLDLQLGGDEQEESEGCDEVAADSISEAVVWGQIGVETPQSLTVHVLKVQVEGLNYLDWEQNTVALVRIRAGLGVGGEDDGDGASDGVIVAIPQRKLLEQAAVALRVFDEGSEQLWDLLEQREDRAGTAIYTAECGHAFHFPCIAAHVHSHDSLVCPVCNCTWKDVPLLVIHKNLNQSRNDVVEPAKPKPREMEKKIIVEASSPRASSKPLYDDDESLFSPTSRIIPIPEADDEDEDEDATDPFPETTTSRSSRA